MKSRTSLTNTLVILLAVLGLALAPAIAQAVSICANPSLIGSTSSGSTLWECPPATPTAVPTATASATVTVTSSPTATATATSTSTPSATASRVPTLAPTLPATATVGPVQGMQPVSPLLLGTCTAAIHDRYVVVANGITYRTWHPQVVPVDPANPSAGTCAFAHEHGQDPRTSLANPSMPAFELIGNLAGLNEPHSGFKVFVQNAGSVNNDTRTALASGRLVVHMGTGGASRFYTQFHSIIIDVVDTNGHVIHVQGMGDAGDATAVTNICAQPRTAKTAMSVPGSDTCVPQSDYEIWQFQFSVTSGKATIVTALAAPAVFDPVSLFNPLDPPGQHPLYLTKNYAAQSARIFGLGPWKGCKREAYIGPFYQYTAGSEQTVYTTDAYGHVVAGGPLTQIVSASSEIGFPMATDRGITPDQNQFKYADNECAQSALLGDDN